MFFRVVDPINAESLRSIETSIFILCLDKSIPICYNHHRSIDDTDHKQRDDNSLALQMLHGQGTQLGGCNRWYDKTMQVCVWCEDLKLINSPTFDFDQRKKNQIKVLLRILH